MPSGGPGARERGGCCTALDGPANRRLLLSVSFSRQPCLPLLACAGGEGCRLPAGHRGCLARAAAGAGNDPAGGRLEGAAHGCGEEQGSRPCAVGSATLVRGGGRRCPLVPRPAASSLGKHLHLPACPIPACSCSTRPTWCQQRSWRHWRPGTASTARPMRCCPSRRSSLATLTRWWSGWWASCQRGPPSTPRLVGRVCVQLLHKQVVPLGCVGWRDVQPAGVHALSG